MKPVNILMKLRTQYLTKLFFISTIIFVGVFVLTSHLSYKTQICRWDCRWYLEISEFGYVHQAFETLSQKPATVAFFPLLPYLIKIITIFTRNYLVSGLFLSNLFLFLTVLILRKCYIGVLSEKIIAVTVAILLFSPYAIYFRTIHTESLFMFLFVAVIYNHRNKNYGFASTLLFFTILCRPPGFLLGVVILFDSIISLKNRSVKFRNIIFYLTSLVLAFIVIAKISFHYTRNLFGFIEAQKFWKGQLLSPATNIQNAFNLHTVNFLSMGLPFLIGIIMLIVFLKKNLYIESMYQLLMLILVANSGYVSAGRYLLANVLFPIFIGNMLEKKKTVTVYLTFLSMITLSLLRQIIWTLGITG